MDGGSTWQNFSGGGISADTAVETISMSQNATYTFEKDGCFWFTGTDSGRYDITITRANYEDVTLTYHIGNDYTLRPVNIGDTFRSVWRTGTGASFTAYFYPTSN